MTTDILLLDDDHEYVDAVRAYFREHKDVYDLRLHHVSDIDSALAVCREHDIRVAIIDLSLPGGTDGTTAISAIWEFDKKTVFVIHSVHPPQRISDWSARLGVPYTSQYFLQKSGLTLAGYETDSARLHELTMKALRGYVPHLPPSLTSVRDVVETISRYSEGAPSFRQAAIMRSIHRSQDVMNAASLWAGDRLPRAGFDTTRIAVLMTGSFARLEASSASDADYFVVFDDREIPPDRLTDLIELAYYSFTIVGTWFERNAIPVHDIAAESKRPETIEWHSTTLPTWFPLSTLLKARLGRSTQLELTKQWFLLESATIFNPCMVQAIKMEIADRLGVRSQSTVRDALAHSALAESFLLLSEEFSFAYRHWKRDELTTVKHYFMRMINLFSIRLWLLRCFLDPRVFDAPSETLFRELSPLPIARLVTFAEFLQRVPILQGKSLKQTLSGLTTILNAYAEAAHAFGSDQLRAPDPADHNRSLVNDLADAATACGENMASVLRTLAGSNYVAGHPQLVALRIL